MRAVDIDFKKLQYFSAKEFPKVTTSRGNKSVLWFLESALIGSLDKFRARLGRSVIPSPLGAGWVREGGNTGSQHYIGPIHFEDDEPQSRQLSAAGDVFPSCDIRTAFLTAMAMPEWGGIGVYLDTTGPDGSSWPMLHLDIRNGERQIWMRYEGRYIYPMRGGEELDLFFRKLGRCK